MRLPLAKGETLTRLGNAYAVYRKWHEWLPILGDYLFRKRIYKERF